MGAERDKTRNKAMKDAVKALAAAAQSLASAAEALNRLCEDDEDTVDNNALASFKMKANALTPNGASTVNYEDSEDEWMEKAREQVRVEAAAWDWKHDPGNPDSKVDATHGAGDHQGFSVSLSTIQSRFAEKIAARQTNSALLPNLASPQRVPSAPEDPKPSHKEDTTVGSSSRPLASPAPSVPSIEKPMPTPPARTWANLANDWATAPPPNQFTTLATLDNNGDELGVPPTGDEAPRAPFQNLINRWARPTHLQKEILESLRMDSDTLICYGHMKSSAHAILVHCMATLKALPLYLPPEGIISALIIVPQQTTGRMWLNFANELFRDFDLPHRALLLPGGNSDVITEAERMESERIDILISSPRIFINHVNSNPALRMHLSRLRFIIFPEAHELMRKEEFLNFQFNMIKKRLQTRAKAPRQIIIATSISSGQIETFAARAFAPNPAQIVSSSTSDDPLDIEWSELLRD
ncbi:DEAD/DEAH box helicase [Ceratobasidium sp. AG-Ba]|nr:DEAD/DEAH box helicase [Ceratobasidium sp. AG-Ba]